MAAKATSSAQLRAVFQALLVTFLWSTSWVIIKIGLDEIPPLIFAGLRYGLAFIFLLLVVIRRGELPLAINISGSMWPLLVLLGIVYYALTQGAQFLSLAYLPAVTANLVIGFTPVVVAFLGILFLAEKPTFGQWVGIVLAVLGILVYFGPIDLPAGAVLGLTAALVGMIANAVSSILGRAINRLKVLSPLLVTTISMGVGALALLIAGMVIEGWPSLTRGSWLIIGWLSLINTAFAFTLWNQTLRTLSAMESSIINNSMAVQIPILAVIFLGERLSIQELIGLIIVIVGVFVVQFIGRQATPQR
ncbi:MAG: DMT family transporter [Ardenticatenaceae bacterium]|nr:DMT family transporter [Ardenticatenaceae bacterium]